MRVAWDGSPSYLRLSAAELAVRVEQALTLLGEERCTVCPRLCKVGRLLDHKGRAPAKSRFVPNVRCVSSLWTHPSQQKSQVGS